MTQAPSTSSLSDRVLHLLRAEREARGLDTPGRDAGAIADELGFTGLGGGRDVDVVLATLKRDRLVELVRRTDGRTRPLLYRATTLGDRGEA